MAATKKTHAPSSEGQDKISDSIISAAVIIASGQKTLDEVWTWPRVQSVVRSGQGAKLFRPGQQFVEDWTFGGETVPLTFDVVHHFDGSDEGHPLVTLADGSKRPAMMIQAHFAVPIDFPFSEKQAFYVAGSDMPAGSYTFDVKCEVKWGTGFLSAVGTKSYTFSSAKPHPKGSMLMWNASYSGNLTNIDIYDPGSDSPESCTASEGTTGTSLGTIGQTASDADCNSASRACDGSNRWKTSDLRSWLNSDSTEWHYDGSDGFHRKHRCDGVAGFMHGLSDDFKAVLGKVKVVTQPHIFDGSEVDVTYDTFFPISVREHGFTNYLEATADGFDAEGVPLDYWTQFRTASGRTLWNGWMTYPELITHDAKNRSVARGVFLRSASRDVDGAHGVGVVHGSGSVGSAGARYAYRPLPAALIL